MIVVKPRAHLRAFNCGHDPPIAPTRQLWPTPGPKDGSIAKTRQRLSFVPTLRWVLTFVIVFSSWVVRRAALETVALLRTPGGAEKRSSSGRDHNPATLGADRTWQGRLVCAGRTALVVALRASPTPLLSRPRGASCHQTVHEPLFPDERSWGARHPTRPAVTRGAW